VEFKLCLPFPQALSFESVHDGKQNYPQTVKLFLILPEENLETQNCNCGD